MQVSVDAERRGASWQWVAVGAAIVVVGFTGIVVAFSRPPGGHASIGVAAGLLIFAALTLLSGLRLLAIASGEPPDSWQVFVGRALTLASLGVAVVAGAAFVIERLV